MTYNAGKMQPCEQHVYFVGDLASAREKSNGQITHRTVKQRAADLKAARQAWTDYLSGYVELVQRRCEGGYEYIAIRRGKVRAPQVAEHPSSTVKKVRAG